MKKIGMVGIGLMGHGIASNLLKHGYPLTVLEHAGNQPLDALLKAGARTAPSCAALAAEADVVILVVTGTPQVEAVLLGEQDKERGNQTASDIGIGNSCAGADGILRSLRPGSVVIDCSTTVPESTERMARAVQAVGCDFLDAPMTRTAKEAAEGRLNLLVGGSAELLARCLPILQSFAENITHAGPVGAGHRMKLLHNYVSLGFATLLAEAAACAKNAGIDPQVFVDVLAQGGGGGAALERLRPFITSGDASTLKFSINNAQKDLRYYNTMAQDAQAAHTVAAAVLKTLETASLAGHGHDWVPTLVNVIANKK